MTSDADARSAEPRTAAPVAGDFLSRPGIARVWNAALGGKDNFRRDRELLDTITELAPQFGELAQANQQFMRRACTYLTEQLGITQYLDLGPGLPVDGNYLHAVAQALNPTAKVLYVDNDPMVVARARCDIGGNKQALAIEGELFSPAELLQREEVTAFVDWSRPIAIICTAALHYHPGDLPDAVEVMQTYVDASPPGSCTVISHFLDPEEKCLSDAVGRIEELLTTSPIGICRFRTLKDIESLFAQQDLLSPGVVPCHQWPGTGIQATSSIQACIAGGIGQKHRGRR